MNPAEAYLLNQDEPFKGILLQLQTIIKAILPEPQLLFKWGIPFYFNDDLPICYLNQSKDYVDLAFWHGDKLSEYKSHFVTTNRTSVSSLRYKSIEEINDDVVVYVLEQQLKININPFKMIGRSRKIRKR